MIKYIYIFFRINMVYISGRYPSLKDDIGDSISSHVYKRIFVRKDQSLKWILVHREISLYNCAWRISWLNKRIFFRKTIMHIGTSRSTAVSCHLTTAAAPVSHPNTASGFLLRPVARLYFWSRPVWFEWATFSILLVYIGPSIKKTKQYFGPLLKNE